MQNKQMGVTGKLYKRLCRKKPRGVTGELCRNDPFLHSEASHPLPLHPIGTILALTESWHF
jgi:hypothetical protein